MTAFPTGLFNGNTTANSSGYTGTYTGTSITITGNCDGTMYQPAVPSLQERIMKGNGKEFLVFAKGAQFPVKAFATEAEALDEAKELADKHDDTYFVYRAITKVSPPRTDVVVESL